MIPTPRRGLAGVPTTIGVTQVHVARRCVLRGLFAMTRTDNEIPRHRAAIEGTLRHREVQLEAMGASPHVAKDQAARELGSRLAGSIDDRWLDILPAYSREAGDVTAHCGPGALQEVEVPVHGGAGGEIVGQIDRVRRLGPAVTLVDLKTGNVFQDGTIRPEYVEQLQLYAALWPAEHVEPVEGLALQVLGSQTEVEVPLPVNAQELIDGALELLHIAKRAADQPETAAVPSPEACRWCLYRPSCATYINDVAQPNTTAPQARPTLGDPQKWPIDLLGTVVEVHLFDGDGTREDPSLGLSLDTGDDVFRVRGLQHFMVGLPKEVSREEAQAALVGRSVGVFEVSWDMPGSDAWVSTGQTIVYEMA